MPRAAFVAKREERSTIKKGKFSTPRSAKQQELELEQAFRQVTMAANGKHPQDGRDRSSNYYSETVVIPTGKVQAVSPWNPSK